MANLQEPRQIAGFASTPGRWKCYPAYKPSGVDWLGEIPAHWEVLRLRHACSVNPPKTEIAHLPVSTEVSFLPMETIGDNGQLDLREVRTVEGVWQGYSYFGDGDVIVAKITPCFENGKGALCRDLLGGIGFGTTELHVLRPGAGVTSSFLSYLTRSYPFRNLGIASMQGAAGQQRVTDEFVKDFRVALPPVIEQRAISAFLDRETAKIDALVAKKERLIALLREKRAALITHAVTKGLNPSAPIKDSGIDWLGQIPAHWEVVRLRRVIRKFVDYRGKTPEKTLSGVRLVTAKNIKNQMIDFSLSEEFIPEDLHDQWMVRGLPERGDVLVTTEAPLGEPAQIEDPNIALAQRIILLKANKVKITNDYLKYHFVGDSGRSELLSNATGSTALGIKASHLKATLVAVPPLSEQEGITLYIEGETEDIDPMMLKIHEGIGRLKEFRTALISAAVTGRIDVRGEVAS